MPVKFSYLIVLFSILFFGCAKTKEASDTNDDLLFDINYALLGESFYDTTLGMKMKIPLGWKKISMLNDEVLAAKFKHLRLDSLGSTMYIDTAQHASILISIMNAMTAKDLQRIYNNPDSTYNLVKKWDTVIKSELSINGIHTYQFLLQSQNLINFKLIFTGKTKQKFQVDYFIERSKYLGLVKKIESSIGTISPL